MLNRDDSDNIFDMLSSDSDECKYYTIESFNSKYNEETNSLSVVSFNIRSAFKNIDKFVAFLKSLNCEFDIIILTETWASIDNCNLLTIDGYNCEHSVRSDRQGGGVCVYINKSLSYNCRSDLCINNNIFVSVGIVLNTSLNLKINLLEIYRPPVGNLQVFSNEFFSNFTN